jgi:RimJ/RimL family protein N-acetyltransferase
MDAMHSRGSTVAGRIFSVNLCVEPVNEFTRDAVLALEVLPEHIPFSGLPSETLAFAESDPDRIPMAVLECDQSGSDQSESGRVIGFFVLCWGKEVAHYASSPQTMGFRSYLIDSREQGRGYGTAVFAVLQDFLLEHHPEFTELNLTVNVKNPRAYRAYLRAGFEDSGELYHGGMFGPQHVLSLPIVASKNLSLPNR